MRTNFCNNSFALAASGDDGVDIVGFGISIRYRRQSTRKGIKLSLRTHNSARPRASVGTFNETCNGKRGRRRRWKLGQKKLPKNEKKINNDF